MGTTRSSIVIEFQPSRVILESPDHAYPWSPDLVEFSLFPKKKKKKGGILQNH